MRFLSLLMIFAASTVAYAQSGPTLRQLAVEHRGNVGSVSIGCGWVGPPLASIVRYADVALEAIVVSKRSYATADDRDIFTEYEVAPKQVVFQRVAQTSAKPGLVPLMIFKTRGGTVMFDGYAFTSDVQSENRRAQLDIGQHVVLFGRYDKSHGTWTFGPRDFFDVSDETVLNWLPSLDGISEGLAPRMPLPLFAEKVRNLAKEISQ